METSYPDSLPALIKRPSAFLPIAMSAAAAVLVGIFVATIGPVREPDEGAIAHVWQLLMAGQLPILGYFLLRWLPRLPRLTAAVFVLQIAAALAAAAPVYLLGF